MIIWYICRIEPGSSSAWLERCVRDRSAFLYKSQTQGLFKSEVERALIDRRADVAVHSLKDLPTAGAPELMVAAIPPRESPADCLVTRHEITGLSDLPPAWPKTCWTPEEGRFYRQLEGRRVKRRYAGVGLNRAEVWYRRAVRC